MPFDMPGTPEWPELDCDARFVEHARSPAGSSVRKHNPGTVGEPPRTQSLQEKPNAIVDSNSALKKAAEDQGLTIEEYNSIIVVAQNDPEVRNRILQRMHPPGEEKQ
jgi:hypothetical protein